jgi:aspartate racemase
MSNLEAILATSARMKTIGLLGGMTHVATQEYYRLINLSITSKLGNLHSAKIIIHSVDFGPMALFIRHQRWSDGAKILAESVKSLETAGADVILCASNTWHQTSEMFMKGVEVPLLHICDVTAAAIKDKGLTRIGLLGTKATMVPGGYISKYLSEKHGLEVLVPTERQQGELDTIIFTELANAIFTQESKEVFLDVIDDLKGRGAQGVILGCTEIPLLVKQEDRGKIPMFDTCRLHVDAAVDFALKDILH